MVTKEQLCLFRANVRSNSAHWFAANSKGDACEIAKAGIAETAAVLAEKTSPQDAAMALDDVSWSLLAQTPVVSFKEFAPKRQPKPENAARWEIYRYGASMFCGGAAVGSGLVGLGQFLMRLYLP